MEAVWFLAVAAMLAGYVVLDGFDIGAGMIHLFVARNERERRQVFSAIGPYWDGNEVWLLAAGGTMFAAFPTLYASSFSGFYLPLMIVLWLLILRGIAIEFRNQFDSPVWKPLWDAVFSGASVLLAVFFGAGIGNVVRGVPLDDKHEFFLPLWTDFSLRGQVGILDAYTVSVAFLAAVALAMHGALWVRYKTQGPVHGRSQRLVWRLWWVVVALTAAVTAFTFAIQPLVLVSFSARSWGVVFPLLAVGGLVAVQRTRGELAQFLGSCAYLAGMLASAAFGLFPYALPSSIRPEQGLTVQTAAAAEYGLRVGLNWLVPGMALVVGYGVFVYRRFAGKVDRTTG
ncbi:MAG: cytochrome d ubiquinol oxidase subunit II [Bryobacteraceae bacterium]